MRITKIIFLSILFIFVNENGYSQTIKVHYHLGFDCTKQIKGKRIRGGCVRNERMEYKLKDNKRYFESNELVIKKEIIEYKNGKFRENLRTDSLNVFQFRKRVRAKEFNRLINYLNLVEKSKKENTNQGLEKLVITKWDKNTFELSKRDIRRIKKSNRKQFGYLETDALINEIAQYFKKENEGFLMSSVTEFLNVSFEHKEKKYSLSQSVLGEVNVSWQIEIDEEMYFIISPDLNKMIGVFLHKRMQAKKSLNQFLKIKELEKAFGKE